MEGRLVVPVAAEATARAIGAARRALLRGAHVHFFFQAEDGIRDVAVTGVQTCALPICMVIGAMWNGARAFTATSGPGISLMNEFLGLAYYAEVPAVIFDIQRVGPSTGMRSEERRGGEERRSRWAPDHLKKKKD